MLDEKEIEEISQNQSSLSDNVYESKNIESPRINYLPEDNSPKKNLMDSNEMNNNFGQIIFEEKKDASNSNTINENKISEEDSDKDNINNFEIESNDLSTPNTFLDNTRQKRNENPKPNLKMIENNHTEQNSTSIINVEYKYKCENKEMPKKAINFELSNGEVNVPHLNFSYNDENNNNGDNCEVNNNDNSNNNLNNNIYQGKKNILNNKYEKDNIEEKIIKNEENSQNDNEENKNNNIKISSENSFNNGNMNYFNNENKTKEKNIEKDILNKTEKIKKSKLNLNLNQKDISQIENKESNNNKEEKKDLSKINENIDSKKDEQMIKVNKVKLKNEFEKPKNEEEKEKEKEKKQDTDKRSNNENILDDNNNQQNYYYFNYDNSYNLRNYYSKKTGKTSFSTEQNTAKKNYNKAEVNSFKEVENQINEAIKTNKEIIENISKKKDKCYKNNYIDDKEDSNKNTNINTNQNSNEAKKYNNMKKIRYINDIDNVKIFNNIEKKNPFPFKRNNFENNKINSNNLYQKENDINIINSNMENNNLNNNISFNNNIENNESNNFNYIYNQENTNNNSYNNINMNSNHKNIVEESDIHLNTKNSQQTTINNITCISSDSMNINTLESITIRRIDEEEQKLTMEIEKEKQRLSQLEQEKMKLIIEEHERRQKILEEIENQEKKEKEKQRKMRKKYEESLMKKKEDEEKLKQLKIEQGKQLKEINELIYKRQQDEEKLVLLAEGKLNKFQRKTYRNSLRKEKNKSNVNLNKLPFDIFTKDKSKNNCGNNGQQIVKRMKNNFVVSKDSRLWNVSEKKTNEQNKNNNDNEERKNIFQNRKMLSESRGFKSYQNLNNYNNNNINNNANSMNNNKIKNKDTKMKNDNRMTIDTMTKINEFMSFSPSINHKKNMFRLSPSNIMDNSNKLNTELEQQIITFSPLLSKEDYTNSIKENNSNNNDIPENPKYPYQKKINKYYKNMNINIQKNIDNSSNKNQFLKKNNHLNEKCNSYKNNIINESDDLNSINELKEIKKITSKMANEIEKKIEIINRNKHNSKHTITKTKSTPKLNSFLNVKNNQNNCDYNNDLNNNGDIINKEENSKVNKHQFKKSYIELTNNIINKETNFKKQKTFIEEYLLPSNIKKEYLKEINKMDKDNSGRQDKGNNQMNLDNYTYRNNKYLIHKALDCYDKKGKKEKKLNNDKDSKNYSGRQRSYYNDFLYGTERDMFCNLGNY